MDEEISVQKTAPSGCTMQTACLAQGNSGDKNLRSSNPEEMRNVQQDSDNKRLSDKINRRHVKVEAKEKEQAGSPQQSSHSLSSPVATMKTRKRKKRSPVFNHDVGVSYEEEKMLNLAIKNSLREQKAATSKDYGSVKEMKTYEPSEIEFSDPIRYIENLYNQGAWRYGCVKIIPPSTFEPPFSFNTASPKPMPTRFQTLQDLSQGKSFTPNDEGLSYSEFEQMAKQFQAKHFEQYKDMSQKERTLALEKEYWSYVEGNVGPRIKVQYAADLSSKDFGSGFPMYSDNEYTTHPWNLNYMDQLKNSFLQVCKNDKISGINAPWVYCGMLFSSFCWHYEDVMMYSLNYMHKGAGKMWYAIPSQDRAKFERLAKEKLAILFDEDPNILLNITAMISPVYLTENGVNVYKTEQKPGEFILTFPESYHAGWSTGFNVAEAVNIVSKSWIDYGLKSLSVYLKTREKVPVFSIPWIATENIRNIRYLKLDKPTRKSIIAFFEKICEEELTERAMVRSNFKNSEEDLLKTVIKPFKPEQLSPVDSVECFYCINLCYLSYVKCNRCKKTYCISHEVQCGCPLNKIKIHERYSNEELKRFLTEAKQFVDVIENEERVLKDQNEITETIVI